MKVYLIVLLFPLLPVPISGYGSPGPIAAAFGDLGFFCAIDAGGKQGIVCWDKNNESSSSSSTSPSNFSSIPSMATLSGGEGFMCGITSNTSSAYCWSLVDSGTGLVPQAFRYSSYSHIAAGRNHVCALRGSYYFTVDYGSVDCWEFHRTGDGRLSIGDVYNSSFKDPSIESYLFKQIVSGEGFSCGLIKEGSVVCWGPKAANLALSSGSKELDILASGRSSVCGIWNGTGEVQCWGEGDDFHSPPAGLYFTGLSAGAHHFCGVKRGDHGVECWGNVDGSSVPRGYGFMAIASSDFTTCGVREVDLVLDCWDVRGESPNEYSPPLQLCSPGVCLPSSCAVGEFAFNGTFLNEPGLTSLCARKDLKMCLPCGTNCSKGFFPSSVCNENADRICTACSLCQNSSCWDICGLPSSPGMQEQREIKKLVIIIGSSVSGSLVLLFALFLITRVFKPTDQRSSKVGCPFCVGKPVVEADPDLDLQPTLSAMTSIGTSQVFRLSELKDATHGFKEFNELGRGSFGFVYKAILSDGRQVAVKRANAATIIHTNSRDFETELEVLCNIRHNNIVNLLGYCAEMGERLLVYEYMPHGTLHDHLHGDLSPLDWTLRLKISLQAAKGLEYLHEEVIPPIVHRDIKTSNILIDSNWGARIADFGLLTAHDRDSNKDIGSNIYNFGIILLEILSGRKTYDTEFNPPSIVEWAVPLIRMGKAAAIIDRNVALPRNVEPLLKLAEAAELALREDPIERPKMSAVSNLLDQILKSSLAS